MRLVKGLVALAVVAAMGYAGYTLLRSHTDLLGPSYYCEARVGQQSAQLDLDQSRYASLIAAVGIRRGLPARAVTIALTTASQESKIRNVAYGDRDSLGLFQQRRSQGWGTRAQILDPTHATNAFYDALVKIPGYATMDISKAAQDVQHSADGSAYVQHEQPARMFASALTGYSPAALSCSVPQPKASGQHAGPDGLTPDARRVAGEVANMLGVSAARHAGGGIVLSYASRGSVDDWALGSYLVANAQRLHLASVAVGDKVWTAGRSGGGWRTAAAVDGVRATLA
ncbi:MAG: hypothetical protein ACRDP1_15575 [Nocardioidaceae bacterium]